MVRRSGRTAESLAEGGALLFGGALFVAQGARLIDSPILGGAGWCLGAAGVCALVVGFLKLRGGR
jgi:hypothetical protein